MKDKLMVDTRLTPPPIVLDRVEEFLDGFEPYEATNAGKLNLFYDQKSGAYYLTCHLKGAVLAQACDTEASLDAEDEDEIYKLNREIQEDPAAFQVMQKDAIEGRSFFRECS